jgi:hypothetical protein
MLSLFWARLTSCLGFYNDNTMVGQLQPHQTPPASEHHRGYQPVGSMPQRPALVHAGMLSKGTTVTNVETQVRHLALIPAYLIRVIGQHEYDEHGDSDRNQLQLLVA